MTAPPPPGPTGAEWGGVNYAFWRTDMFGFLSAVAGRHGDIAGFSLGRTPVILVNGAPQVRELLVEREPCLRKPELVKQSNRGHWGDGLTTLEGEDWQARRSLLRPSFTASAVAARMAIVEACTREMLPGWAPASADELRRDLRLLTARIAARVVLDADLEGHGSGEARAGLLPVDTAYGEDYTSDAGADPEAPLLMVRPRAPRNLDAVLRMVDERLASGDDRGDVLSALVRARLPGGAALTRDEIAGEVIQMLYAGHLTIPASLVAFWREMVANRLVDRLASEAEVLCRTAAPDAAALSGSYCLAAVKEALRMHPPAPLLYREVERAFELGGFAFDRNVAVWVSPQLLHHDSRYYDEPRRFRPERFFKGGAVAMPGAYLPFGAGPRTCIGQHLALQHMTLVGLLSVGALATTPVFEEFAREGATKRRYLT